MRQMRRVPLPIEWIAPPDAPGGYATELIIQRTENEYHLYFFTVPPPIVLGGTIEEQDAIIAKQLPIKAHCVSHIIVAANKMPEFVKVMQTQFINVDEENVDETQVAESDASQ